MNVPTDPKSITSFKITTGPLTASRKVYATPEEHPELRVPLREIALSEGAGEPAVRVYDSSGIYTESMSRSMPHAACLASAKPG